MTENELPTPADWADLQQGSLWRANSFRRWHNDELFTDEGGCGSNAISYGCLEADRSGPWWTSSYCSGSDYSGGSVHESNYRVLLAECERLAEELELDEGQLFYQTFHGGYGTYAIALHTSKTPREVYDMILALEDYPVLDEGDLDDLETSQQDEAWDNWAAKEYAQALESKFDGCCDAVDGDDLFQHFQETADVANVYWEDQGGQGQYIDIKRVAAAASKPPRGFVYSTGEKQ